MLRLTIDELDDQKQIGNILSNRTVLYNLEPIGIGTPFIESLTSYISRLATAHNISVSTLLKGVIAPLINKEHIKKELSMGISKGSSLYINEINTITLEYVSALEILTGRRDILNLTMLNWQGIFSKKLRSPYRKWCPACFEDWKMTSKEIYEPLIWFLADIQTCDIHETRLRDCCPVCNRKLLFLHSHYQTGYCQYCESWLGNQGEIGDITISKEERFTLLNYKQLIENAPKLEYFPSKRFIGNFLNRVINDLGFRSKRRLADFLGYNPTTVWEWINNKYLPSHESLFKITQKLNYTLYEIIYKDNIKLDIDITPYNYEKKKSIPLSDIQTTLVKELHTPEPMSLYRIAKEGGFGIDTAQRHYPLLCQKIQKNYKSYSKQRKVQKQKEIESSLNECLLREIPISFEQFLKESGLAKKTVRRNAPDLCKKVSKRYIEYLSKLKEERIERILYDIREAAIKLHDNDVYPSISKLQKALGNKSVFLEDDIRNGWEEIVLSLGYKMK